MKKIKPKLSNSNFTATVFTFYLLLSTFICAAQDSITISGAFQNNTRYAQVVVQKFDVGSFAIAATPIDKESGKFSINIPADDLMPGVYRLQYSQSSQEYVDVILNGNEPQISFTIDAFSEAKQPVFTHSKENKLWYSYKKEAAEIRFKIDLLLQLLGNYPSVEGEIYTQNTKFYETLIKEFSSKQKDFIATHPDTWACEMVANEPVYFPNPRDPLRLQMFYQRQNFWEAINTQNPELINTPLYTSLILQYLQYYMNPDMQFSEEEVTKGFQKSTDTIMTRFGGNQKTQEFAYKYLSLGFKEIGQKEVLQYLEENYTQVAQQCLDDQEKDALEQRLAAYEAMKVGSQAPDITFTQYTYLPEGVTAKKLSDVKSDKYLIVFAAGWCPHCTTELPKVAEAYPDLKAKGIEVVLVSLDENANDFAKFAAPFPFISTTDLQKWDGQAVEDYQVYATPSYFMIDKNLKLVGKFSSLDGVLRD